jgi:hypothetical protein
MACKFRHIGDIAVAQTLPERAAMRRMTANRWLAATVLLGIGLRAYHYLRQPSVWHDEAALLVNVIEKGFRDLLGPLIYSEASPPLFLWAERAMALAFGDGVQALRFLPFAASCATLVILALVARRLVGSTASVLAVFLVACSNRLLWHSCEAKPYAIDTFVAVSAIALFVGSRPHAWWIRCGLIALCGPIAIWLSYPGCFICGGLIAATAFDMRTDRRPASWLALMMASAAIGVSFLALLVGPARAQQSTALLICWHIFFPPSDRLYAVPLWTIASSLDTCRYCFEPAGAVLGLFALAGARRLWRLGRQSLVMVIGVPAVLTLAAAFLRSYPWGGARVDVFLAPAIALFAAHAIVATWSRIASLTQGTTARWSGFSSAFLRLSIAVGLAGITLAPCACAAYWTAVDWHRADCDRATRLVLKNWKPGDGIAWNCWEGRYYFRDMKPWSGPIEPGRPRQETRLWMVITDASPHPLVPLGPILSPTEWRLIGRRNYRDASVYLMERRRPVASVLLAGR